MPQLDTPLRGIVLKASGGVYRIHLDAGIEVDASIRGRLKLQRRTGGRVVAGDIVHLQHHEDDDYTIEAVAERRTQLARRAPGRSAHRAKVLAANIDQVVVVIAVAQPETRFRTLDRFLVLAAANHLPAVITVNKTDLVPDEGLHQRFQPYAAAGYTILYTSAVNGVGMVSFHDCICRRNSVLTGPSGVGKSSLLNKIQPGLQLRTGAVNSALDSGRHTTVTAQFLPLDCGGYVADTPGLREVSVWRVDPVQLPHFFPEFSVLAGECQFGSSCSHVHEPGCAIREAVADGNLSSHRYNSYLAIRADAEG